MKEKIRSVREAFFSEIGGIDSLSLLEPIRIKYLGKKGHVQGLMKYLVSIPSEEKPTFGKLVNDLKREILDEMKKRGEELEEKERKKSFERERIDVTLPGRRRFLGRTHPITQMIDHITSILAEMEFSIQYSSEIETEYYNYDGLNYPEDHPARDMQDTFYLDKHTVLRSHTTTIQQHIMEKKAPPIRVASPGKCYRNETITARSHVFFHQVDVLYIDRDVSFADLLATNELFYTKIFGSRVKLRVRPSYFPFVEPGMEVDIQCTMCTGSGCPICKHTGYLEVSGAGMVHPHVLQAGGIDPEMYSGYAWGGGIERLCMLLYGIEDIRLFTENDFRFLSQFSV